MGHIMREKKLKNPKNNVGDQNDKPLALSWDTLPDLAKNRWEEAVAFDVTVENQLAKAKAKADRTIAESERQRIAKEILDATKDVCKEIITDGQRALNRATKMEAEAAKNHSHSQDELEQAHAIRSEAENYRARIMAEVDQEAKEFIDKAKSTIDKECLALRTQAAQEAQRILGQVELMKTAVQEELETQKIYTDAARIKVSSDELLSKLRAIQSDPDYPEDFELDGEPLGTEVNKDQLSFTLEQTSLTGDSSSEDALSEEYGPKLDVPVSDDTDLDAPVVDGEEGQNGKKNSRKASAVK
jgi:hypothetical protein